VAVTTFASHIPRIRSVAEAGQAAGREVVIDGRAMARTVEVARETGWLDGVADFRSPDVYGYLPPDKALLILTGSQGEPRAALARIAAGDHPEITLSKGDRLIFSSRTIPGNERGVNRIINALIDRGIEVITDRTHTVHVSGHPRRGEMTELYGWLKPRAVVPVHGEALHLHEHRKLAQSLGIPNVARIQNGDILQLAPGAPEIVGEAPVGRLFKDGKLLDASDEPVRERRRLAFGGVVSVALALNASGEVVSDPEIEVSGLPERDDEGESLLAIITEVVEETLENLPRGRRRDPDSVAEALRRAVRAELKLTWGKKPLCQVMVLPV
jgi:ribonuclease J